MEEIDFGGEKYIASKKAAKMVGYTNDYVGQLCREGKINCRRIGREWYVNESSLLKHKEENKSKKKKEQESWTASHKKQKENSKSPVMDRVGTLYYKKDEGPLYPSPAKKQSQQSLSSVSASKSGERAVEIKRSQKKSSSTQKKAKGKGEKSSSGQKKIYRKKQEGVGLLFKVFLTLIVVGGLFIIGGTFVGTEVNYSQNSQSIEKNGFKFTEFNFKEVIPW